jgi:hypothetical protein
LRWRKANADRQVLDIAYTDVEQHPMEVVQRSYDFLRLPLTENALASISGWLVGDTHGVEMRHEYSLETCGLSVDEVQTAFGDYISAFQPYLH